MGKKPVHDKRFHDANRFSVFFLIVLFENKIIEEHMINERDFYFFVSQGLEECFGAKSKWSSRETIRSNRPNEWLSKLLKKNNLDSNVYFLFWDVFRIGRKSPGMLFQNFGTLKDGCLNASGKDSNHLIIPESVFAQMKVNALGLENDLRELGVKLATIIKKNMQSP